MLAPERPVTAWARRHLDLPGSAASAQSWEPWIPPVVSTPAALTRASTTEKLSRTFHGPPLDIAEIAGPRCAAAALAAPWTLRETTLVDNDFTTRPRCAQGGLRWQPCDGRSSQFESRTRPLTMLHHPTTPTPPFQHIIARLYHHPLSSMHTGTAPAILKLFLLDP
jgi:hypothetical protein